MTNKKTSDTHGEELQELKDLLYAEENSNIIAEIKNMSPLELHILAANFNWNSGFEIPEAILGNGNCDLGTGLLLFYRADGYRVLESKDAVSESAQSEWKDLISNLFDRIVDDDFPNKTISFTPPLTKVQAFKLRKSNPSIPEVFLDKSPGDDVAIPVL
ncbi:DUF4274 domain-containing protein [Paenibacillus sp. 7124]|uniref:DUF4274 domain-containing protein n=1 Tax=Paenibacillus apii TaxID=1850370 RepID=A0A6M1PT23_9BACL|nr:DUF4274 domain-containing protein [Paenibacillus apii]NGM85212.1 DUF4274 domain-containing protein [Paenibacillus apii]NJJ42433.1 DUF4274 domain-containing protein [Paenibacillus apii]